MTVDRYDSCLHDCAWYAMVQIFEKYTISDRKFKYHIG